METWEQKNECLAKTFISDYRSAHPNDEFELVAYDVKGRVH